MIFASCVIKKLPLVPPSSTNSVGIIFTIILSGAGISSSGLGKVVFGLGSIEYPLSILSNLLISYSAATT